MIIYCIRQFILSILDLSCKIDNNCIGYFYFQLLICDDNSSQIIHSNGRTCCHNERGLGQFTWIQLKVKPQAIYKETIRNRAIRSWTGGFGISSEYISKYKLTRSVKQAYISRLASTVSTEACTTSACCRQTGIKQFLNNMYH